MTVSWESIANEHILGIAPYEPGKPIEELEREFGLTDVIKLASNENPLPPSERVLKAISDALSHLNRYPDGSAHYLRVALGRRHGLTPEHIIMGNGSNELIELLVRGFLRPGEEAVIPHPSFVVYPMIVQAAGGIRVVVTLKDHRLDLEAMARAIPPMTKMVFIANPNNPTGTILTPQALDRFMAAVPEHVCVVLDEAYCDFAEFFARERGVEYSHSMQYVHDGRNVVVLRTFSKAHGLAGLRIGYGIAPAEQISYFARMRTVFQVTNVAEAAALAAIEDEHHIRKTLENNAAGVDYLSSKIAEMGLRVVPTWANFVYVEVGEDAAALAQRMQDDGIIIRPLTGNWGAPRAIRITVGTPEQNRKCVATLKKVAGKVVVAAD
ncbi:MAG: histidinol-phosphate transaminase [Terriglobales bacterium]